MRSNDRAQRFAGAALAIVILFSAAAVIVAGAIALVVALIRTVAP